MTNATIYRRPGSLKVTCKRSGAFAFISNTGDRFTAQGFLPKATRNSAFHYRFKNEAERNAHVAKFFDGVAARQERRAAERAERLQPHRIEVGHVFATSWGYEQTNVEFFEVTRLIGKNTVELREVGQVTTETGMTSGRTMPRLGHYTGEAFERRVSMSYGNPSVRIHSSANGHLWNGKPKSYSWGH